MNEKGLFFPPAPRPLVKTICGDEASLVTESGAKGGLLGGCLGARVDCLRPEIRVFRPEGHQAPAGDAYLTRLPLPGADDENIRPRRDVVSRRNASYAFGVFQSQDFCEPGYGFYEREASAHRLQTPPGDAVHNIYRRLTGQGAVDVREENFDFLDDVFIVPARAVGRGDDVGQAQQGV